MHAFAEPRGGGKTTRCHWAVLYAVLNGHSPYTVYLGPTQDAARRRLKSLRKTLLYNTMFREDYPEACLPIVHARGKHSRAQHQLFRGEPSGLVLSGDAIVLASTGLPYAKCDQTVLDVAGMEGEIRGRNFELPSGRIQRPTLCIADDPQTRGSARSVAETEFRETVLAGDVRYMSGPDEPIGVIVPCTVICRDDLADRILDRERHPEYQGVRTKFLLTEPTNKKRWDEYFDLRRGALVQEASPEHLATVCGEFYREHQEELEDGASVSWDHRMYDGEVSAIQHALNRKFEDEAAFMAEYQNEPLAKGDDPDALTVREVEGKVNGMARATVPIRCSALTAFVDVSQDVLWYVVCAWEPNFTGYVIDYGTWPEQGRRYFTSRDIRPTLKNKSPQSAIEGAIRNGLDKLVDSLLSRDWKRDDGADMQITRCLIDQGWKDDVVCDFCRQSHHRAVLMPAKGFYISPLMRPFAEYRKEKGGMVGNHWRIPTALGKFGIPFVLTDANYWKSFVAARFKTSLGDAGCLSLFQASAARHRMFAEQVTAEWRERVEAKGSGRVVDVWQNPPGRDNHFWDCLVGCAVAASMVGIIFATGDVQQKPRKKRKATYL